MTAWRRTAPTRKMLTTHTRQKKRWPSFVSEEGECDTGGQSFLRKGTNLGRTDSREASVGVYDAINE